MVPLEGALTAACPAAGICPSEAAMLGFTLNCDNFLGVFASSIFACIIATNVKLLQRVPSHPKR